MCIDIKHLVSFTPVQKLANPIVDSTFITVRIILYLQISSFIYYVHWIELNKLIVTWTHVDRTHTHANRRTRVRCVSDIIQM